MLSYLPDSNYQIMHNRQQETVFMYVTYSVSDGSVGTVFQ